MTAHLTAFQRDLARRLHAKGMSLRDVAREIGCSKSGIDVVLRGQARDAKPDTWVPRDGHLSASDREEILLGLQRRESMSEIGSRPAEWCHLDRSILNAMTIMP